MDNVVMSEKDKDMIQRVKVLLNQAGTWKEGPEDHPQKAELLDLSVRYFASQFPIVTQPSANPQAKLIKRYGENQIPKEALKPEIFEWCKELKKNAKVTEATMKLDFFRQPLFQDMVIEQPRPRPLHPKDPKALTKPPVNKASVLITKRQVDFAQNDLVESQSKKRKAEMLGDDERKVKDRMEAGEAEGELHSEEGRKAKRKRPSHRGAIQDAEKAAKVIAEAGPAAGGKAKRKSIKDVEEDGDDDDGDDDEEEEEEEEEPAAKSRSDGARLSKPQKPPPPHEAKKVEVVPAAEIEDVEMNVETSKPSAPAEQKPQLENGKPDPRQEPYKFIAPNPCSRCTTDGRICMLKKVSSKKGSTACWSCFYKKREGCLYASGGIKSLDVDQDEVYSLQMDTTNDDAGSNEKEKEKEKAHNEETSNDRDQEKEKPPAKVIKPANGKESQNPPTITSKSTKAPKSMQRKESDNGDKVVTKVNDQTPRIIKPAKDVSQAEKNREEGKGGGGIRLSAVAGPTLDEIELDSVPQHIRDQGLRLFQMEGRSNEVLAQYNTMLRAFNRQASDSARISALETKLTDAEKKIYTLEGKLEVAQQKLEKQGVVVEESRTSVHLLNQLALQRLQVGTIIPGRHEQVTGVPPSYSRPPHPPTSSTAKNIFLPQATQAAADSPGPQTTATVGPQFFQSTPAKDASFGDLGREIFNLHDSHELVDPAFNAQFTDTCDDVFSNDVSNSNTTAESPPQVPAIIERQSMSTKEQSPAADSSNAPKVAHTISNTHSPLGTSSNTSLGQGIASDQPYEARVVGGIGKDTLLPYEVQDGRNGNDDHTKENSNIANGGGVGASLEHVHEGAMGGAAAEGGLDAGSSMELETSVSEGEHLGSDISVSGQRTPSPPSESPISANTYFGLLLCRTSRLRTTLHESDLSQDGSQ
ncbi:hypothetical protein BKA70DRAFT_1421686 [Coprinopsis sp. MPI-PUGE-AT-0042]|nr:hypothetical protein BKA70DRAFT_1421686 [Coprinopsis sp. MPI-PUGE-AT-0042]